MANDQKNPTRIIAEMGSLKKKNLPIIGELDG
jgi:hypothetical protein